MGLNLEDVEVQVFRAAPLLSGAREPVDHLPVYDLEALRVSWHEETGERAETLVASAKVILLDAFLGESLWKMCDDYSRDLSNVYQAIFTADHKLRRPFDSMLHPLIWYIDHLIVEPEYRGRGVGTALVNWIANSLAKEQGAMVALSVPLEIQRKDNLDEIIVAHDAKAEKAVKKFLKKLGFFPLKTTNDPLMYRVLEWKLGVRELGRPFLVKK